MNSEQPELAAFVGLDWADEEHAFCLCVAATKEIRMGTVKQHPEKLHAWINSLREEFGGRPVGIAIEKCRGGLIHTLMQYEFLIIYPINPKSVAKYRESFCVSGAKDDPLDSTLLMELIYKHRDRYRAWVPDKVETRMIQLLSEQRRNIVDNQTRLTNQLEAVLKGYFPQAIEWAGNLATKQACDFLAKWPSLKAIQKAKPAQLRDFYMSHGCRRTEVIEERIKTVSQARCFTDDAAVMHSSILMVQTIVDELRPVMAAIARFDKEIAAAYQKHPDRELYESLPGAGEVMEPRLLAAMGSDRSRFDSAAEVQQFSGIAPVTKKSGKMCFVHRRYACPRFIKQTFHEWAGFTIRYSDWAQAYYEYQRKKGKGHHSAIRSLAFKWIRILFRCWKQRVPYSEQIYIASLGRTCPDWAVQSGLVKKVA